MTILSSWAWTRTWTSFSRRYELKNRGRLGRGFKDVQTIDMLGRTIKITKEGISWEGDPRHKDILVKHFGMNESTKVLNTNGHGYDKKQGGSRRGSGIDD